MQCVQLNCIGLNTNDESNFQYRSENHGAADCLQVAIIKARVNCRFARLEGEGEGEEHRLATINATLTSKSELRMRVSAVSCAVLHQGYLERPPDDLVSLDLLAQRLTAYIVHYASDHLNVRHPMRGARVRVQPYT